MLTPLSFPCIISGDDDWHKVSQEISLLTTVLKNCRAGKVQSAPSNSELQFFQHISTLVTTGRNGTLVNAVSGHVGADKIVSIVFTRNAGVTHVQDGTYAKITPSIPRGRALLETWKLKIPASFAEHLQNVVDGLSYISSTGGKDDSNLPAKMALFTLRCALPELSTRVHNAIRLWGEGPFHLVARYYRERTSPINVTSTSFAMKCPKEIADLQHLGLNQDETNPGKYHVDSGNIGKWVNLIDTTYSEIESIVLKGGKPRSDVLSFEEGVSLLRTIGLFRMLIGTKLLIAAILAPRELDKLLQSIFRTAANTKNENGPGTDESSSTPRNDTAIEVAMPQTTLFEDDAFDGGDPYEMEGGTAYMLRYFRKITAWYDAAAAVARNAIKYPALPFDVYHVDVRAPLSIRRSLQEGDLISFRERCFAYFQAKETTNYRYGSALIFLDDKLGGEKLCLVARDAALAVVHVEAMIMGLACISISGGEPFGNVPIEETKKLFHESRNITIALDKKCCRSCAMLAEILKDHHDIDFVLPGMHTNFFPWSPPRGVPLDDLRKMRDDLCVVFEELACTYVWIPNPATSSETFDIEPLDLSLVSYIDTKSDGDAESDS